METLDVSKMTDEQLTERINVRSKAIDVTRKDVALMEADLANMRTELRRRKLAAFWQANEGLRLEVGDALLALHPSRYSKDEDIEFKVADIDYDLLVRSKDAITITNAYVHRISISLDIARRMREAYLQTHGEAQP